MNDIDRNISWWPWEWRDVLPLPKVPDLSKWTSSQTLIQYQKELLEYHKENGKPDTHPSIIECREKIEELEFVQASTVHPVVIVNNDSGTLGSVVPTKSPCIFMNAGHFQSFNKSPNRAGVQEPLSPKIKQQHIHVLQHEGEHLSHHRNWSIHNELPGWDKLSSSHKSLIFDAIGVSYISLRGLMEGMTESATIAQEGVLDGVYSAEVKAWRRFDALVKNRTGVSLAHTFANKQEWRSFFRFESAVIDIANQLLLQKTAVESIWKKLTEAQIENIKIISHISSRSGVIILDEEVALGELNDVPLPLATILYNTRSTFNNITVPHGRWISIENVVDNTFVNFFWKTLDAPQDVKMLQWRVAQSMSNLVALQT